ncbi:MAG: DNA polymerase III subunit alpha [Pseudomonadota bacterium]|nr:DNA polymerase III subunit alpha [Pseudomonadota bacterium]
MRFTHLHVHSEYSLCDSSIKIVELLARVKEFGHDAVAITDHGNLHGMIEFYERAKALAIKPIIGCEIYHRGLFPKPDKLHHLVLLAKNNAGYHNLIKISSAGAVDSDSSLPIVSEDVLDQYSSDLIALSACHFGELAYLLQSGSDTNINQHVERMQQRFGKDSYYVELIDNRIKGQRELMAKLATCAKQFSLPLVCSADAHYLHKDFRSAHDIYLAIMNELLLADITKRDTKATFHLLSDNEVEELYGEYPEAIANTSKIADRCNVELEFGKYHLPNLAGEPNATLRQKAEQGLTERLKLIEKKEHDTYRKRLNYELEVIIAMNFAGYFLIVHDFVAWACANAIPVGAGRGSGAGSLVAYALQITDINPIQYDLIFERFLNPERVSMPDFDIDFCQDRRDEVIKYVTEKYGFHSVAQICTFGRLSAKAVVRDVGRVLGITYKKVDMLAKLIPNELEITLQSAFKKEPRLQQEVDKDEEYQELIDYAQKLEGLIRNTSTHAAGVVISDKDIANYVPVSKTEEGFLITQYEMKNAERAGLVKFDFLGLKTLSIIDQAVRMINADIDKDFKLAEIPLNDRPVYKEISAGFTTGIFQLDGRGMTMLLTRLCPTVFADIVAAIALFRPGPLGSGMVEDFIRCKNKLQKESYLLPQLEPILKETYGIIVYQEQVQKIAAQLANYSLGEADLLRRAMGKKKPEEMNRQRDRFISGCKNNGIADPQANSLFDLMAKFAEYGFNKSHSTAYGMISYQTAYLKVHYPAQFLAAQLTYDYDHTFRTQRYIRECKRMGVEVHRPDINFSNVAFTPDKSTAIRYGLKAVKGLGHQAVKQLLKVRAQGGEFTSILDLMRRIDLSKFGKRNMERMVEAGCFDGFGLDRKELMANTDKIVKRSGEYFAEQNKPQKSLFASFDNDLTPFWRRLAIPACKRPSWESLLKEKSLLGEYMSFHPLSFYQADKKFFHTSSLAQIVNSSKATEGTVLVLVNAIQTRSFKNSSMTFLTLEDVITVYDDVFYDGDVPPPLNIPILLTIKSYKSRGRQRISATRWYYLHELRMKKVQKITLHVGLPEDLDQTAADALVNSLAAACAPQGKVAVDFQVSLGKQTTCIATDIRTVANDAVVQKLQSNGGILKYM